MGLSVRSLLTGLPPAFLATGRAWAADPTRKFAIIAQSGAGEAINGCGPGSFDAPEFIHPSAGDSDYAVDIAGTTYTADDLSRTTVFIDGAEPVRYARCFEGLGGLQDHLTFFNYRTGYGIHPEMAKAQVAGGAIKGPDGRGAEQLPSAIAQENAAALGTLMTKPIVIDGSATYGGAPLNTYPPTVIKALVESSVGGAVPSQMYGKARNFLVDRIHRRIKQNGDQRRFLDEFVISQSQADEVASKLLSEVVEISDDGYTDQMRMAAIIIKLRLAPVVVVGYRFTGDNHVSDGLTVEAEHTLRMMATYRDFYDFATAAGVWNQCVYGTVSVFGRSMNERGNGRGHNGRLSTGLLFGSHLGRRVVGGINPREPGGVSLPFNSATGGIASPDITEADAQACYVKSVMKAAGIPEDRLNERVRDVPAVALT